MRLIKTLFLIIIVYAFVSCETRNMNEDETQKIITTDILVVGGGTSGVAAALQAARMGSDVVLIEKTDWLGGMLTAAGVSATDGNHNLPSGIWGEFRNELIKHYGSQKALATGWVSNTHFEPNVGNDIWHELIKGESNINLIKGYFPDSVELINDKVKSVYFRSLKNNSSVKVNSKITIDATELGDIVRLSNTEAYIGQDPVSLTGEKLAADKRTPYIQDLTYVAILEEYQEGTEHLLEKPQGYDPKEFDCLCREMCDDPAEGLVDCQTMLNYAKLPNGKYMINWPNQGNDYYVNVLDLSYEDRLKEYEKAKLRTLNWIYHIQTVGGYTNLGLSKTTFSTEDHLALIPYHRESRRIKGVSFLTADDLKEPFRNHLYQMGIAVGDYPLDHHHKKNPKAFNEFTPETDYPIPSFSIPYGSLVPEKTKGLLVAEKSISVSHIANGSTRLQPCVILIGQASGMAAHLAAEKSVEPTELSVRELQNSLLQQDAYILPYYDSKPTDWHFESLQKFGALGIIKGNGVPYQWANQMWIYPDTIVTDTEFRKIISHFSSTNESSTLSNPVTQAEAVTTVASIHSGSTLKPQEAIQYLLQKGALKPFEGREFQPNKSVTRSELVYVLDVLFNPFLTPEEKSKRAKDFISKN